jgi:diguanylate cyclase (GGDEF)-like protein
VQKLFARQLAKAKKPSGETDIELLGRLVVAAYEETERDRQRADRSMSLMIEELDRLNRGLEQLVEERTLALREREAELKEQNLRFDAAINNMTQALLLFDASGRLLICNRRYHELYGVPPEVTSRPGCTVRDLLEYRRRTGTFTGDPESFANEIMQTMAQGKTFDRLAELPDGRVISVVNHPMPGGGWVVTQEDVTERRRAEEQIAHLARHDFLTGLPNRLFFRERLAEALHAVGRGENIAVLYLDLDHFKNVNDTLGHPVGDELLKLIAGRLRQTVRQTDTLARVGGDEFAVIQTRVGRPVDAVLLARRICDAIQAPCDLDGHRVMINASIGIATTPGDGTEADELLKNADTALYGAKSEGRGVFRFFEPEMDARMKARRSLEFALRQALAGGEFELHYQPVVRLHDQRVTCCEALIRWNSPVRGMVPPSEFIPLAEEIGLIAPLGEWVLRRACSEAADWPQDVKVAVNLSSMQVNQNLVEIVVGALAAAGLPASRLELEITESVLMKDTEATLGVLHRLRELGAKISLDDFGIGYSSLSYLRSFPFDKIKIDRCFISGLPDAYDSVAIVRAVTTLARSLNMVTTAEGVETKQQRDHVRALGCTEMQGHLFSPAISAHEVMRLFRLHANRPKRALSA